MQLPISKTVRWSTVIIGSVDIYLFTTVLISIFEIIIPTIFVMIRAPVLTADQKSGMFIVVARER